MTAGAVGMALGPVSTYVRDTVVRALDERRIVVWYDGERAFGDLVSAVAEDVAARGGIVISAVESNLRARREADAAYRHLAEPGGPSVLLVYLPSARAKMNEERRSDPFAAYAEIGV